MLTAAKAEHVIAVIPQLTQMGRLPKRPIDYAAVIRQRLANWTDGHDVVHTINRTGIADAEYENAISEAGTVGLRVHLPPLSRTRHEYPEFSTPASHASSVQDDSDVPQPRARYVSRVPRTPFSFAQAAKEYPASGRPSSLTRPTTGQRPNARGKKRKRKKSKDRDSQNIVSGG
jgi:hypothetical protein